MEKKEEQYIHFVQCIQNLNNSWRILQEIANKRDEQLLVGAAFQFALVEYAKSFTKSKGTLKNYKLSEKYIPTEFKKLHKRIIDARHQIRQEVVREFQNKSTSSTS